MVFYGESSAKPGGIRGPWSHNAAIFKDNPGKKLTRHDKSDSHIDAIKSVTNLKIKHAFEKTTEQKTEKKIRLMNCLSKSYQELCTF